MSTPVVLAFQLLAEVAEESDSRLATALRAPPIGNVELAAFVSHIQPLILPTEISHLYGICGFSRMDRSSNSPRFIGGFTFVPFSEIAIGFDSNEEIWRHGDSLFLPIFSDGSGSEICFECSRLSGSELWRRDLDDPEPKLCFDSIVSCLLCYAECVKEGLTGVVPLNKLQERHAIFRRLNPKAANAWEL